MRISNCLDSAYAALKTHITQSSRHFKPPDSLVLTPPDDADIDPLDVAVEQGFQLQTLGFSPTLVRRSLSLGLWFRAWELQDPKL